MSAGTVPARLSRGFSDEAASAFAELVTLLAATTTDIEAAITSRRTHFSTAGYSVNWTTTEKFAWLFAIALEEADATRRVYWLKHVRDQVLQQLGQQRVQVA